MFETLTGFRAFYPEECAWRNHLFALWKQSALRYGFQEYDAPVLESQELYTRKSGEEIVGQLYAFEDKGGRAVALRPELTPSLARMVGAKAASLKKPVKWFNIGENYRYERPQKGRLRAFYQFNADILGEPGPGAEAELIGLLAEVFTAHGLQAEDVVIRLSDRDLWLLYLAGLGKEGEDANAVLQVVDKLERTAEEKALEMLQPLFGEAAADFLGKVRELTQLRSLEDIRTYFDGHAPDAALKEKTAARLAQWDDLLDRLDAMGLMPFVQVDLGIVRGLAYYTGFVFEAFERGGTGRALAGGGRYDHLLERLGYNALPAVGFAMGDVTFADLLEEKKKRPPFVHAPEIFAVIGGDDPERRAALADVAELRRLGFQVEFPLRATGFGKQFKAAGQSGARFALIYGGEEVARAVVKVRDLAAGTETEVPQNRLAAALADFRENGLPADSGE